MSNSLLKKCIIECLTESISGTYFIRFGDWPKDERSNIWYQPEGSKEDGVSVYEAGIYNGSDSYFKGKLEILGPHHSAQFVGTLDSFIKEFASGGISAYLVSGNVVGVGSDGEPLLRNVKKIKKLQCSDLYDCAHYMLRMGVQNN